MRANRDAEERTFTENARRAQIVRAAIETIGELGYARASFGQVAKRAGLSSTGMISYHFDGKADLVAEVTRHVLDKSLRYMGPRVAAADGYAAKVRAYVEANLEFIRENPAELRAILDILHNSRAGQPDAAGNDAWYAEAVDLLEQLLVDGQRAGEFGDFDPRVLAIVVRQGIDGFFPELEAHPDTDPARYADGLVRIIEKATARNREKPL
jgi:AcrR family transcriptional regulator